MLILYVLICLGKTELYPMFAKILITERQRIFILTYTKTNGKHKKRKEKKKEEINNKKNTVRN